MPLNGSALYGALLRAGQGDAYDLARVSVDVLSRGDVEEAYAELGLSAHGVHVREETASAATLVEKLDRKPAR